MEMRHNDCRSIIGQCQLDLVGVHHPSVFNDIDQNRSCADRFDGSKVPWEIITGQNHFIIRTDSCPTKGEFNRDRAT